MKQKLLLFILPVLLFTATLQAQTKVWDFGNDTTTWPLSTGIGESEMVIDQLGLFPITGKTNFGAVNASNADFTIFSGETYTAVQRFQMNGGGGVDPTSGGYLPVQRYLYFDVDGACTVKVWFKTGSNGGTRTIFVTDGSSLVGSESTNDSGTGGTNGDLAILNTNYGSAGRLYIFGDQSNNLYKVEVTGANVTTPTLGLDSKISPVTTNVQGIGNRVYVSNVKTSSEVKIYSITGALVKSFKTNNDVDFALKSGLYIATIKTNEGQKSVKLVTN